APSAAQPITGSQGMIPTQVEKVRAGGLPTDLYQPEIDGIAAEVIQAQTRLTADPIGARSALEQAQQRARTLQERMDQILKMREEAKGISAALAALGDRVGKQRKGGLRLDEEGGNPDSPISQTVQTLEALG